MKCDVVKVPADNLELEGELCVPQDARGLVIFAHGSGSSRHSPRNKFVAERLQREEVATLLVDLLSEQEGSDYANRFNIDLLKQRLQKITQWTQHRQNIAHLPIGYFGASTGAAAAVLAAKAEPGVIKAVVSRGGRVDLAQSAAAQLQAPTLLIVGELDTSVRAGNESFYDQLPGKKDFAVIPGATHLFEEAGALERVADTAAGWFREYLRSREG